MAEWNKSGVPHKGWVCIDVVDLADCFNDEDVEYEQCEMCGNERIRYVHIMRHQEYPEDLHVGCVCAEKMTDDYVNPRRAERELRNRASRRTNFNKIEWRYNSSKGTYSKKYKGEYITIVKSRYGTYGIFFAGKNFWDADGEKIRDFMLAERVAFNIFEEYHTTQDEREYNAFVNGYDR
ncbi:MAG: hypothetical protein MJZ11_08840 [Lachnospiraceae bacterium]|nr:hypothetical protein [Lachnospiraceae bacterium]